MPYYPIPPFEVQYFCPRQGNFWQRPRGNSRIGSFEGACSLAALLKPAMGHSRVIDGAGVQVYFL